MWVKITGNILIVSTKMFKKMYINNLQIPILYKFKLFNYIVCDTKGILYQLDHCITKRTKPLKKLKYNAIRNAYRINSVWVTRKRLDNLKYKPCT